MKKYLFLVVAVMLGFSSCLNDKDDPEIIIDPSMSTTGVYVVNAGIMSMSSGTLSYFDYQNSTIYNNVFRDTNGVEIGDTFNDGIVYDNKIYLAVNGSNVIHVVDRSTLKLEKTIVLDKEKSGPRRLAGYNGNIYVTLFSGYLAKINTKTLTVTETIEIGPNPEAIVVYENQLYVAVSDALNQNTESSDACIAVVDPGKMAVTKRIQAGKNLTDLATNGSALFVLSSGEYESMTWKQINYGVKKVDGDKVSDILFAATDMVIKDNTIYYIDNGYLVESVSYGKYDINSGSKSNWIEASEVQFPAGIGIDPTTGDAFILSNNMGEGGYADYTSPGYMVHYAIDGAYKGKYNTGVCPTRVFFNYE